MSTTDTTCTCPSGDGSLRWPCPTHPPTEHDERLREARALVSVLRRYPGDRQTPAVRALLVLEEEATRLDAVVTTQAETIRIYERRIASAESYDGWDL